MDRLLNCCISHRFLSHTLTNLPILSCISEPSVIKSEYSIKIRILIENFKKTDNN